MVRTVHAFCLNMMPRLCKSTLQRTHLLSKRMLIVHCARKARVSQRITERMLCLALRSCSARDACMKAQHRKHSGRQHSMPNGWHASCVWNALRELGLQHGRQSMHHIRPHACLACQSWPCGVLGTRVTHSTWPAWRGSLPMRCAWCMTRAAVLCVLCIHFKL